MTKKIYENPKMSVVALLAQDIVRTSNDPYNMNPHLQNETVDEGW